MRIRIGSVGLRRVGWVESGAGEWGVLSASYGVLYRFVETIDFGGENEIAFGQAIDGMCPNS